MWKKFGEESPESSGWILLSTNKGLAYAHYDREKNQLGQVHLLGDQYNTTEKIKHWAKIEAQPAGDFEVGANGFQTIVK